MARFRDIPVVMRTVGPVGFYRRVWAEISQDQIFTWAAALAYSWLFAIFPFFIILLSLLPVVLRHAPVQSVDRAEVVIGESLDKVLPHSAASTLLDNIHDVMRRPHGGLLGLGVLVTLWAASGGMSATMSALDRCHDVTQGRSFYKQRLYALFITLVATLVVVLVLVLLPVGTLAVHWLANHRSLAERWMNSHNLSYVSTGFLVAWNIGRYALALGLLLLMMGIIHFCGPNVKSHFHMLSPGAVFTLVVWLGLGYLFRFYINQFAHYDQTYGAVGGVAILLFFFYIDAVVLLIGAEINTEIDFAMGIQRGSNDFRHQARK